MSIKANYHTHSTYCDGKHTLSQMAQFAYENGFTHLGFSGHSHTAFDERYCMKLPDIDCYLSDIAMLQKQYHGLMEIYAGVEQDFYAEQSTERFDYAIGSVHYVYKNGQYFDVDESEQKMVRVVQELFSGDFYSYVKTYFETVAEVIKKTNADIIGHFDLVTKFNEGNKYFDMNEKKYRFLALEAMEALLESERPFEINTGAMYRKLRTEPYPCYDLLKELYQRKGNILLSSDSHTMDSLGYQFAEVTSHIKEIGFTVSYIWTPQGYKEILL